MNIFLRFALWISRYRTMTITVGNMQGFNEFGETMTVIGKKK